MIMKIWNTEEGLVMSAAPPHEMERRDRLLQLAKDVMMKRAIRQWEQSDEYMEWFKPAAQERLKKITK